jgi:hypothetical protein
LLVYLSLLLALCSVSFNLRFCYMSLIYRAVMVSIVVGISSVSFLLISLGIRLLSEV